MPGGVERRCVLRNQWPFSRTTSVREWINQGRRFFESVYEILIRQKELTPETLRGVSGYAQFENRPDIHPLAYVKPGVLERVKGASVIFVAFMAPSAGGKDTILKMAW